MCEPKKYYTIISYILACVYLPHLPFSEVSEVMGRMYTCYCNRAGKRVINRGSNICTALSSLSGLDLWFEAP